MRHITPMQGLIPVADLAVVAEGVLEGIAEELIELHCVMLLEDLAALCVGAERRWAVEGSRRIGKEWRKDANLLEVALVGTSRAHKRLPFYVPVSTTRNKGEPPRGEPRRGQVDGHPS